MKKTGNNVQILKKHTLFQSKICIDKESASQLRGFHF